MPRGLHVAELAGADRPLVPAVARLEDLAPVDLLGLRVVVGVSGAADVPPRGEAELQAAVVAVARAHRPVAVALALSELLPRGGVVRVAVAGRGRRGGGRGGRDGGRRGRGGRGGRGGGRGRRGLFGRGGGL